MTLAESKEGQTVVVRKVKGPGPSKRRLMDMGISRGTELKVERFAPLRDPIQIKLKGYSLALRRSECAFIETENEV